jgi:hypothetical protein
MKISAATFPTKSIPNFVSSYALAFAVGIAAITIVSIVAQYLHTWQPELVSSQVLIGLSAAIAPFIVRSNERKVMLIAPILQDITSAGNKKKLLVSELKRIEGSVWASVFPIIITFLGLITLDLFGSPWRGWNPVAHYAFSIFVILFFLVAGTLGWQYSSLMITLFVASRFDVESNIFSWPAREIKKLNQITIEIYFAGVLVYLGAILAIWALPWGKFLLTNDNLFTRLWVFPIAVIVISYFLALQYNVHRLLSTSKAIRLEKIDTKLEELSDGQNAVTFDINLRLMNELISWRKIVEAEPEWPLNIQTSLGVIGTVLIPTLASISDIFTRFFGR